MTYAQETKLLDWLMKSYQSSSGDTAESISYRAGADSAIRHVLEIGFNLKPAKRLTFEPISDKA